MTVLVDTSVFIDHLRGRAEARDALATARRDGHQITASALTRAELLGGMRSSEKARTRALFLAVGWVDVDREIAERAGELARQYRRSHAGIDLVDYVIAATAELSGGELLTRNVKHFPMIVGLAAPY
ncbi:type II toxin-antitoxin system VapC family toxin [Isoptericola hypogeus]|uniref:Ribonuclease VapC n=1 Tax=Isoptericola hypogeus TaxID=300179 RepID=A0ABN2JXY3_9MICO